MYLVTWTDKIPKCEETRHCYVSFRFDTSRNSLKSNFMKVDSPVLMLALFPSHTDKSSSDQRFQKS